MGVHYVLGVMSGTSTDGLDLALCAFTQNEEKWHYSFIKTQTLEYPEVWERKLRSAEELPGRELFHLDHEYGKYIGKQILLFLKDQIHKPLLIASHGHTVFHEPDQYGSLQIGNGHDIFAQTGIPVIMDFRSLDIALGGQGAPLVPVGDKCLFPEFTYCLNLGGFSNISYPAMNGERIAYDVCPVNIVLNYVTLRLNHRYDPGGKFGRKGKIINALLSGLNQLEIYTMPPPRSFGRETLYRYYFPMMEKYMNEPENLLATLYEHISTIIALSVNQDKKDQILITGGGAHNEYLIEKLRLKIKNEIVLPQTQLTDYKEALIFAFLGLLKKQQKNNCLASVTGAFRDSAGGVLIGN